MSPLMKKKTLKKIAKRLELTFPRNSLPCNMVLGFYYIFYWLLISHSSMVISNVSKTDGDETGVQRASKTTEKARRHALSSSALQGLREEYMDTPAEIVEHSANSNRANMVKERQERQE